MKNLAQNNNRFRKTTAIIRGEPLSGKQVVGVHTCISRVNFIFYYIKPLKTKQMRKVFITSIVRLIGKRKAIPFTIRCPALWYFVNLFLIGFIAISCIQTPSSKGDRQIHSSILRNIVSTWRPVLYQKETKDQISDKAEAIENKKTSGLNITKTSGIGSEELQNVLVKNRFDRMEIKEEPFQVVFIPQLLINNF